MKVLGVGNAIVDVLCKVDDQFIQDHNLTKGTMKLIDEQEFKKLLFLLMLIIGMKQIYQYFANSI